MKETVANINDLSKTFHPPAVAQADNGRELGNNLDQLKEGLSGGCRAMRGRPTHPQAQGSIERASRRLLENFL